MGRADASVTGREPERDRDKKLIRGVRQRMARAGAPEQGCPGAEHCGWLQEGENPCAGCGLRDAGRGLKHSCLVEYSMFLAAYIEAFRPEPERLRWLDLDLYQAVLAARAGYESEQARKFWKK